MKKFIYTLLAYITIIVSLYFLISYIVKPKNKNSNDYMAAMIDKHNLAQHIEQPKIIFAGGSNLAFGINSEEIEKEFSIPVVNMGLHAGLGLDFILNELRSTIKNGDIVFLSIEYYMNSEGIYDLKKHTSRIYKEANKYYKFDLQSEIQSDLENTRSNIKNYKIVPSNNLNLLKSQIKPEIEIYSREAFNKFGDDTANWEKIPPKELSDRGVYTYTYWKGIDELNSFYDFAKSKNVTVFFIYPNLPLSEFNKNKDVLNKLSTDLSKNLKMKILNTPSDFVYGDSLFFDTVYHLTKKGRELRTKRLIEIIKRTNAQQKCLVKCLQTEEIQQ